MEFAFLADTGRLDDSVPYRQRFEETVELVGLAEAGGFSMVCCGEHHGIEMTTGPNPLEQLAYLGAKFEKIRLGTAIVSAPYWHPLRLAGEAAMLDVMSSGRLELGIGRGAFPYEFKVMANGISPEEARESVRELTLAVRGLWDGNYTHEGKRWAFDRVTSTPRPIQAGGPPIWLSARHPDVFKFAVENHCDVQVYPLYEGPEEVANLKEKLDTAVAEVDNGFVPRMMTLQMAMVVESEDEWEVPVDYQLERLRLFDSFFAREGNVDEGFIVAEPDPSLAGRRQEIFDNLIFGTPEQVIEKLKVYREHGTDIFLYGQVRGVPHELATRSMKLFTEQVIPALAD